MIQRDISAYAKRIKNKIPVLLISGPRQSGKTTLVKELFKSYTYVNLENPVNREFAINDPQGFLGQYGEKLIIDEVQYAPNLLSYIQEITDKKRKNGLFILTGSQNLILSSKVSQSLAGRIISLTLLPLSINELTESKIKTGDYEELIYKGFYPRIYSSKMKPEDWYPSYIHTYIERDVRQIINIGNIRSFQKFIRLTAGRIGQLLNFNSVASETGVSYHTIQSWISVLEASYIICLINPFYENYRKRIVKTSKLYFYDTGLACSLLGIDSKKDLTNHFLKGALYENLILSEFMKSNFNFNRRFGFYFWRDSNGNEIDFILEKANKHIAVEVKSSKTFNKQFLKTLEFWKGLSNQNKYLNLVYGGEEIFKRDNVNVLNWKNLKNIMLK